jgi:hypothetical protein
MATSIPRSLAVSPILLGPYQRGVWRILGNKCILNVGGSQIEDARSSIKVSCAKQLSGQIEIPGLVHSNRMRTKLRRKHIPECLDKLKITC